MASKLEFDSTPSPASGGGRKLEFDRAPVKPAGPPAPPISGPYNDVRETKVTAPVSGGNIDTRGMTEDPNITAEKQRNSRVQAIADHLKATESYRPGVTDYIGDSFFQGVNRPLVAGVSAGMAKLRGAYPGVPFSEVYQGSDRYLNDRMARAETATGPIAPLVGGVASLPASMALSGAGRAASKVVGRSPVATTGRVMRDAAIPGFVEGAAKHAETPEDAIKGGVTNAALSAVTAGTLDKAQQYGLPASRRAGVSEAKAAKGLEPAAMKDAADTFYKQMDRAGVRYDATQTAPLYQALHDMRNSGRYDEFGTPELRGYFDRLMGQSRNEMSYSELQTLRSVVAGKTNVADPNTRRAAGEMLGHIDSVIRGVPAINPQGLDMANLHSEASRLWRGSNLASDLDFKAGKAGRMVEAGKDINPDAKLRDDLFNYRERITAPRAYNPLGDKGSKGNELLDQAIENSSMKRKAGEFLTNKAPVIGATAGAGATLAGFTHGNAPGWAAVSAVTGFPFWAGAHYGGKALQSSAHTDRLGSVDALLRHVTDSPKLPPGATISRDDLAKILFAQDLERIAPRVGSAAIGNQPDQPEKKTP